MTPKTQAANTPRVTPCRVQRWLHRSALGLLLLVGLLLGCRQLASPDLGFHLSLGRWIVENHRVPQTDPLTYTLSNRALIDPQWLFQTGLYLLKAIGGTTALVLLTTLLTLVFGALLVWRTWRREGRVPLSSAALLLLFWMGTLWELRPHLASWVFGSVLLLLLEEYARGNRRWLPFLPVVMVLWVNTHSLFVLGLVCMGVHLVADTIQHRRVDKALCLWCGAAGVACLLNPYHYRALLFPLIQFRDLQGEAAFKSVLSGVAELTSPFAFAPYKRQGHVVLFQARLFWQLFSLAAVVGMAAGWRKTRLADWLLFAGFLYVFGSANKNFGYFVMACFPPVAVGLDRLGGLALAWLTRRGADAAAAARAARNWRLAWLAGCSALCVLLGGLTWTGRLHALQWTGARRGFGFNAEVLPVNACRFLNEHHLAGRLLNAWDDGGYIAWATRQKVFLYSHGEVVGRAFYADYVHMKQPDGFPDAMQRWQPTVVVVPYAIASFWLYYLNHHPDWRLVYTDPGWGVFLHQSVAPAVPALPKALAGQDFPVYAPEKALAIIQRAASAGGPGFRQWCRGREAYPMRETALAAFYLHSGQVDACLATCLAGLERTPFVVPDLLLTLGYALNARRYYDLADLCFDAVLRADGNPETRQELALVRRQRR